MKPREPTPRPAPVADEEPATGFRRWLMERARPTDTPAGHFVHEARRDPRFPCVASREQLIGYLRLRGAPPEMLAAVDAVWVRWRAYRPRRRP